MSTRIAFFLTGASVALLAPIGAAQQPQEPPAFIYVAEWGIPRAKWDEFTAYREKTSRPVLERHFASGTIVSWGNFAYIVHDESGITHGSWWTATSIAGIERVRDALVKLAPNPAVAGGKHRDYLLRTLMYRSGAVRPTSGYLWVNATLAQPGKGQEWRDLWEKYTKPTFDELLASGAISSYEVDVEQVHTEDPGWRYIVYIAPSAEGVDKVAGAIAALIQKRTAEENRTITAAFAAVTVPNAHRDSFMRVATMASK